MIRNSLKSLCLLSIFCGAALSISPEGSVKRIMNILVSAILLTLVILPFKEFDYPGYALFEGKLRQHEKELAESSEQINDRLNRLVIEEEYGAYIMDKAAELHMSISELKVNVYWSTEGLWLPQSVSIKYDGDQAERSRLEGIISAELGIAPERQYWNG